jgi:hypothetical protein
LVRVGIVDPLIDYRDQTFIDFRSFAFDDPLDHGFRWVDLKRFRLSPGHSLPADELVLRSLVGAEQFADGYAGGGVDPVGGIHGPYRLGRIAPESYEHVDAAAAIDLIDGWARQYGDRLPTPLAEALEEKVYAPLRSATGVYRLKELGEDASHDFVVHGEFYELVAIDRATLTVSLVVAADD